MNRRIVWGLLLLVVAGALALRLPGIEARPMHNDEAVNAAKFQELWEAGTYTYDPDEYHGPTLPYLTLPLAWLSRAPNFAALTETPLRLTALVFGVALVASLPLLGRGLGRGALLGAAALTALSPAMVFYSRYYIHEMVLVFFSFVALAALWRYLCNPRPGWAVLGGAAAGLMYATKETFVLSLGAMAAGFALAGWWQWRVSRRADEPLVERIPGGVRAAGFELRYAHGALALGAALGVAVLFFSSFGTNPAGVAGAVKTYLPWLKRAGGHSPHLHPWYFYLGRLAWFQAGKGPVFTELFILALAAAGGAAALRGKGLTGASLLLARALAGYTVVLAGMYSAITYKTPWCLLGFWHGALLLAGLGVVALWNWRPGAAWRALLAVALAAGGAHLGWQAWQATHAQAASRGNPWVYGHTSANLLEMIARIEGLARVHPQGHNMVVQVMAKSGDYWPLPWYLRRFKQAGFWDHLPTGAEQAPVMVVSMEFEANYDSLPQKTHLMAGMFQMRPATVFELYVETALWKAYVPTLPRRTDDD